MNPIAALLPARNIVVDLDVATKAQFFGAIGSVFERSAGLTPAGVAASLAAREKLGSTGLGQGIAIPHGRIAGISKMTGFFAQLDRPVDFDAMDDQPVDLVFLLLAPEGAGADHLKALARVSRLLRNQSVCEKLRAASQPAALYALLTEPLAASSQAA